MTEGVKITADSEEETIVAKMLYNVGYALSLWYMVEEDITSFYARIVCPEGAFVDGAIATLQNLHSMDQKINLTKKVLDQIFYQDDLIELRQEARKCLNKILKLNETRNKIAHGRVVWGGFGGANGPRFGPFYIEAAHMRSDFIKSVKLASSVIPDTELWTLLELESAALSLQEGRDLTTALLALLDRTFVEKAEVIKQAARFFLGSGTPFDSPTLA